MATANSAVKLDWVQASAQEIASLTTLEAPAVEAIIDKHLNKTPIEAFIHATKPVLRDWRDGGTARAANIYSAVSYRSPDVGERFPAHRLRIATDGQQYRVEVQRFSWIGWLLPRTLRWEPVNGTETKDLNHARHWRDLYTDKGQPGPRDWTCVE